MPAELQLGSVCPLKPVLKVQLFSINSVGQNIEPCSTPLVHSPSNVILSSLFKVYFSSPFTVACGGELNAPSGTISSPNYPNLYPHSRVCRWELMVTPGRRVTLTINDLRLEDGTSCVFDYIDVSALHYYTDTNICHVKCIPFYYIWHFKSKKNLLVTGIIWCSAICYLSSSVIYRHTGL